METTTGIRANFPVHQYPILLPNQEAALERIERTLGNRHGTVVLELPTGSGKTAVGYTFLRWLQEQGKGPLFYITPTKTLVEQVHQLHPDTAIALGRNAHECLYYPGQGLKANDVPCALLADCKHRVDQETGATFEPGAIACPYLRQKFEAKRANIVVCTTAFYLFTQLFSHEWEQPAGLVIDEAHRVADVVRGCLSFQITDYHLRRAVELLKEIKAPEHKLVGLFLKKLVTIVAAKPARRQSLLTEDEIYDLYERLLPIDPKAIRDHMARALASGAVKPIEHREVLNQLQVLTRDLRRYLSALEFSLPGVRGTGVHVRPPLNYTFAFHAEERSESEKVRHKVVVRAYYVNPLVKKMLGERNVAFSATIGDPEVFSHETGISGSFERLKVAFPVENTRVFMPSDTPSLATRTRKKNDVPVTLGMVAQACRSFAKKEHRSLVVVTSEAERAKFIEHAGKAGVKAISYGNGVAPKDAALAFKSGSGDVLVGTVANYGEGVDLPRQVAPVIFFLRPSYPRPDDPQAVFEERRFGGKRWGIWNWRVMIESLQVRGRNVRSGEDVGVTFFCSQQFRRFLFHALPEWLKPAYRGEKTFSQCVKEAQELLR